MFVPEYTLTAKTLKNIGTTEYSRAIVENTVVLQNWEKKLQNQTLIDEISSNLQLEGFAAPTDIVKKVIDDLENTPSEEIVNLQKAFIAAGEIGKQNDINELGLKSINQILTGRANYRSSYLLNKTSSAEILAEIVELFDWINSIDARDSHPVIVAAITKARLEEIVPFENFNATSSNLIAYSVLQSFNYSFKDFVGISSYFNRGKKDYFEKIKSLHDSTNDFTQWIEYFSEAFATQAMSVQEKIKLLAKDTKIAKATGRIKLTPRQEKIVEYLQDYGILQNKDFPKLFPDKSEDSILRDLKALIDHEIIHKVGSTKSSRYELK
jgi:Fic family protein